MKNSIPYCGSLTLTLLPEATLGFYVEPDFHPLEYVRAGRTTKKPQTFQFAAFQCSLRGSNPRP